MGNVAIAEGNILQGGADLTVLPCSAKGTVSSWTAGHLRMLKLPLPGRIPFGGVSKIYPCMDPNSPTRNVVFAASVLNGTSREDMLEEIARRLGELSTSVNDLVTIETPLLGTGAGRLPAEISAKALKRGFVGNSASRSSLSVFVSDNERWQRLNSLLTRDSFDGPKAETVKKILFLGANSRDHDMLQINEEARCINEALVRADYGRQFQLVQQAASRTTDLNTLLLRHRPEIVHFSGHGSAYGELYFVGENGSAQMLSTTSLKRLFEAHSPVIRMVVLNACYSKSQARALSHHIPCVIGIEKAIEDRDAIRFSESFYEAIAFGKPIGTAFDIGVAQVGLGNERGMRKPKLVTKKETSRYHRFVDGPEIPRS